MTDSVNWQPGDPVHEEAPVPAGEVARHIERVERDGHYWSGIPGGLPMTTSRLTLAADLVESVAAQDRTAAEALALLEAHGGSPDRVALSEAVAATHLRDTFLLREGNPYEFVGVEPRAGLRVWQMAVELAEQSWESHIRFLAMAP